MLPLFFLFSLLGTVSANTPPHRMGISIIPLGINVEPKFLEVNNGLTKQSIPAIQRKNIEIVSGTLHSDIVHDYKKSRFYSTNYIYMIHTTDANIDAVWRNYLAEKKIINNAFEPHIPAMNLVHAGGIPWSNIEGWYIVAPFRETKFHPNPAYKDPRDFGDRVGTETGSR